VTSAPAQTSGDGAPVTPSSSYAEVLAHVRRTGGKSNRGAAAYTRWVNRPLGRRVAALSYRRGWTPNQLTAVNACLILPTLVLIAVVRPNPLWNVVAALLLLSGYVLDSADGQLARIRGGGSKAGEWLDHVTDALKTALVHAVVAVVWFRFYEFDSQAWLLVPLAFGVVHSTQFFSLMLADDLRRLARVERREPAMKAPEAPGTAPILRSLLVLPNDWGVFCLVLMLLSAQWWFVAAYGALFAVNLLFLLAGWVRWYRELVTI